MQSIKWHLPSIKEGAQVYEWLEQHTQGRSLDFLMLLGLQGGTIHHMSLPHLSQLTGVNLTLFNTVLFYPWGPCLFFFNSEIRVVCLEHFNINLHIGFHITTIRSFLMNAK